MSRSVTSRAPRRLLGVLAAVLVALPVLSLDAAGSGERVDGVNASLFSDVPAGHPFYDEIDWVAVEGIARGYPDGTFRPAVPITRQAMATFAYRYEVASSPAPACTTAPFSDVPRSHPFCGEIAWMKDAGLTTGFDDGTFRPGATITRQAAATILYRLLGSPEGADPTCVTRVFSDVVGSHRFCGEITLLNLLTVVAGYDDGTFGPERAVTRQAMAAFFYRLDHLDDAPVFRGTWTETDPAMPAVDGKRMSFLDVSCPVVNWCLAAGGYETDEPSPPWSVPLMAAWDGDSWTSVPTPPETYDGAIVSSVSCWAVEGCVVVLEVEQDDDLWHEAWVWDGSDFDAEDRSVLGLFPADVDCLSTQWCMVTDDNGIHAVWDGDEWAKEDDDVATIPVACASPTFCVARQFGPVGSALWDGASWTLGPSTGPQNFEMIASDCAEEDTCLGGGHLVRPGPFGPEVTPRSVTFDGTAWAEVPVPTLGYGGIGALSCAASDACLATASGDVGRAFGWNGGRWYPLADVPQFYRGVSCVEYTCVAVGARATGVGNGTVPVSATYTWPT